MVTGAYRDLFVAIAGAAGALTGLLFVALSVAPRPRIGQQPDVIRQVRAGAALLAFTNALGVSLFGLVPHNEIGYPAVVVGVGGLLFTLGGVRSILADPAARRRIGSQLALIVLLLGVFGFEIGAGINSIVTPHTDAPIDVIGNVLAASLLIGIARSWELVGDRDTGFVASIAHLVHRRTRRARSPSRGIRSRPGRRPPGRPRRCRASPLPRPASPAPAAPAVPASPAARAAPADPGAPGQRPGGAPCSGGMSARPQGAGNAIPPGFQASVRVLLVLRGGSHCPESMQVPARGGGA